MMKIEYLIKSANGIHAIPACKLAVEAKKFQSRICIIKDGQEADIQDLIHVMGLNVKQGNKIIIQAEGLDEDLAIHHMQKILDEEL